MVEERDVREASGTFTVTSVLWVKLITSKAT